MLAELMLAVVLTGNLKIVKPAVAPVKATIPPAPVLRLYPDLPEPYDQLPVSEEQHHKLREIFENRRKKIEQLRRQIEDLDNLIRQIEGTPTV